MIDQLKKIAREAGKQILEIYNKDFDVEYKEDSSPLTEADKTSHDVIVNGLDKLYPDIPALSEESKDISYEKRKDWKKFFLVDPLDGTKEFVKKNGEFTVNIALIDEGKPVLGIVYAPVKDIMYFTSEGKAFKQVGDSEPEVISARNPGEKLVVVASRSHFSEETKEYIEKLGKPYELVNIGSSLKLCLVAEGKADIYPRLAPTMEWDTAAAHAVVNMAGKKVYEYKTDGELEYNKKELVNPWFVVK